MQQGGCTGAGDTSSQPGRCGAVDHLHAHLLGVEGADSRCFPGTKPPGAPLGAVTAAQPPSCCQALCPELVIAGAGQHSPHPQPVPVHSIAPSPLLTAATWGCPILPGPLLLSPSTLLPSPAAFCLLIQGLCSSHRADPAKLPAQAGHPTGSVAKSLSGFSLQG